MKRLMIRDYGEKFRFLVGHKPNEPHGRLRDVTDGMTGSIETLSQHQLWVVSLSRFVQTVPHYLLACERAEDTHGTLLLLQLETGTPQLATNRHGNWAAPTSPGPEERLGTAAAALYGCGCPEDDRTLPLPQRRALWDRCDHPLWISWCKDSAAQFTAKYSQALKDDQLAFPKHIRVAMQSQSASNRPFPQKPPKPSRPRQTRAPRARGTLRWGAALSAAVTLVAFLVALWAFPPPRPLASALTWIECMPGAGMITLGIASNQVNLPCAENGLLPVDDVTVSGSDPFMISQAPFDATFSPHTIKTLFWQRTVWRPAPSFANMLHRRTELYLSLDCASGPAEIVLDNQSWGPRRLTCATPTTQVPRLEPSDLQLSVAVIQGPAGPLGCSGVLPPQPSHSMRINPSAPCAGLARSPLPDLPVRSLIDGLDMVQDPATGLVWLTDPLLFGSAWEWAPAAEWGFKELLQKIQQVSDGQVWRLAGPQEVMLADPAIFRKTAGNSAALEAVAKDEDCPGNWRKVILSLNPERSTAAANATIPLPCLFKDPHLGFWLVQDPDASAN